MQVGMMFCEIPFHKKETIELKFNGKNLGKGFR